MNNEMKRVNMRHIKAVFFGASVRSDRDHLGDRLQAEGTHSDGNVIRLLSDAVPVGVAIHCRSHRVRLGGANILRDNSPAAGKEILLRHRYGKTRFPS